MVLKCYSVTTIGKLITLGYNITIGKLITLGYNITIGKLITLGYKLIAEGVSPGAKFLRINRT